MRVHDTLSVDRIRILGPEGPRLDKAQVLSLLGELLAASADTPALEIETRLKEREALRSTGIGEGVAIPHAGLPALDQQYAALIISPSGIEFDAIDNQAAHIILGVVGPQRAGGEHLKLLARVSRLLRDRDTRNLMTSSADPAAILALIGETERGSGQ